MEREREMGNITQEEVSKLTRAMKDKQFQSHMDEYCKEISDPAHRREYLQYLDQLEDKGEMPEGQCLLRTEPGCCVKTTIKFKNGQTQKCFINIVHSDRLEDMSEVPDDKGGKRVQLPYSLSPPRPERDNKDENCMTCDFAVSTWTFGQAIQRPNVLKMLVDTASDGLSSQFLKGHEEVKKDFKVMRRIRCRGPGARPLPMSVKDGLLKDKKGSRPVYSSVTSKSSVTPSELREMRKTAKEKMLKPPENKDDGDDEAVESIPTTSQESPEPSKTPSGAPRIRVPKHKLVHSGAYDLSDFMESSNRPTTLAQSVPRMLKLIVELPTVKKSSDVSLDVTSSNVCIEVPEKYYLDLPLSYEIDEANGNAKFDKVAQILTLELPVKPKPPDPNLLAVGFRSSEMEGETGDADSDGCLSENNDEEDLPPLEDVPASPTPQLETQAPPPAHEAGLEAAPIQPRPSAEDLVPEDELPRFVASESFAGARQGYAFKLDDQGLGYYRDPRQCRPVREGASKASAPEANVAQSTGASASPTDAGAPLIEEVDDFDFVSANVSTKPQIEHVPLSRKVQEYIDVTSLLTARVKAEDCETCGKEPSVEHHQTRQNLIFFVGVPAVHEVSGVQLSFVSRRLGIVFHTRAVGGTRWQRHQLRRTLCRAVDIRQWHAELCRQGSGGHGADAHLLITVRKSEQGDRWPEVFDASAVAVTADQEPIAVDGLVSISEIDTDSVSLVGESFDQTAAADTAAGTGMEVIEDSAELDIAAPVGAPCALGPAGSSQTTAITASSGTSMTLNKAAATAAAQSASVMGQAVLLQTRLMYQLF
jgi:hypothetical protein